MSAIISLICSKIKVPRINRIFQSTLVNYNLGGSLYGQNFTSNSIPEILMYSVLSGVNVLNLCKLNASQTE